MPQYTDTVLKVFPFSQVGNHGQVPDGKIFQKRNPFDFDYTLGSDDFVPSSGGGESEEEIDKLLVEIFGTDLSELY